MSDYNQFVLAVNKIFEITAKLKQGWKDTDNINIADSIEESKTTVVEAAKLFNTQVGQSNPASSVVEENKKQVDLTTPVEEAPVTEVGALGK